MAAPVLSTECVPLDACLDSPCKETVKQSRPSCSARGSFDAGVGEPGSPTIGATFACDVADPPCCTCAPRDPCGVPTSATELVKPTHYDLAAASFYAGVSDKARRETVVPGGVQLTELEVVDHRATGLRVALFTGREYVEPAGQRCSVCGCARPSLRVQAAVLAFRGTSLGNRGHLLADWGILKHDHRSQELAIADEAHAVVLELMAKLRATASPEVQFVWYATGHSLGAFLATTATIRAAEIHACVTFEAPGCPRLYRELAGQRGGAEFWREKMTSYLALPSPINMQHKHIGRVVRVELDYVSRVHAMHVMKSISGTLFRWGNWVLLLLILLLATEVLSGVFVLVSVPYLARLIARLGFVQLALLGVRCVVNLKYKLEAHKLSNMIPMFCTQTGKPKECVEMVVWPESRDIKRKNSCGGLIWHALIPSLTGDSIMHLFTQRHLITNQMFGLPGYQERAGDDANQLVSLASSGASKQPPPLPPV